MPEIKKVEVHSTFLITSYVSYFSIEANTGLVLLTAADCSFMLSAFLGLSA
jgi:hypothetical protein